MACTTDEVQKMSAGEELNYTSKSCIRLVLMALLLSMTVSLPTSRRPIDSGEIENFSSNDFTTVKLFQCIFTTASEDQACFASSVPYPTVAVFNTKSKSKHHDRPLKRKWLQTKIIAHKMHLQV